MDSDAQGKDDAWADDWKPIDSPPPDGQNVLVVVRDDDGELLYSIGRYWAEREPDPLEGLDGKPFWWVEDQRFWPRETLVKWRHLPPI